MRGRPKSEETASVLGQMSPSSEVTGHTGPVSNVKMTVKNATVRPTRSRRNMCLSASNISPHTSSATHLTRRRRRRPGPGWTRGQGGPRGELETEVWLSLFTGDCARARPSVSAAAAARGREAAAPNQRLAHGEVGSKPVSARGHEGTSEAETRKSVSSFVTAKVKST